MKRNYIAILITLLNIAVANAQSIVTNGLNLHLDAATGFTNTGTGAVWNDLSGAGNDVKAISVGNSPIQSANAAGTPFTGIYFDGVDDYMFDSLGVNFNTQSATYFIVRIGNTLLNSTDSIGFNTSATTLSIASQGSWEHEFAQLGDWALHHTYSGNWTRKTHQCYYQLPDTLPVITACVFDSGINSSDLSYYINGILSSNPLSVSNAPLNYPAVARSIIVGARFTYGYSIQNFTPFQGHIMEILAYNRPLTVAEVDSVNDYLKCKYAIKYTSCNADTCAATPPTATKTVQGLNSEVHVFPNPVNKSSNLTITAPGRFKTMEVSMIDITGRTQLSKSYKTATNTTNYTFQVDTNSPSGIYLLKINIDDKVSHHKILLQ